MEKWLLQQGWWSCCLCQVPGSCCTLGLERWPKYIFLDVFVNGNHILVSVSYRATNVGYLFDYKHDVLQLQARCNLLLVMGDLNIYKLGRDTYYKTYLTTMTQSCNLTIFSLDTTHHTATWLVIMQHMLYIMVSFQPVYQNMTFSVYTVFSYPNLS